MERISRALELASARKNRSGLAAVADEVRPPLPQDSDPVVDPVVFTAPIVQLDQATLARERILPPNAGGPRGSTYKLLRTQVLQRLDQLGANTLAILSSATAEGKTQTAINLAIAIAAEFDRTVLLVDFDLRNPSVHRRLGFEPAAGVESCLQSGRPVQEVIVRLHGYERLSVLPAHTAVVHSSELLASKRAISLMTELRSRYSNRIMIFDLPPVLLADDALAFSRLVQAGLVVVAEGRTKRDELKRTIELLHELPLVGTVLNGSRESARSYY